MSAASPTTRAPDSDTGTYPSAQTIRILLVGEPHVGKSLLIHRLCHEVFADAAIEAKLEQAKSSASAGDATIGFAIGAFVRDSLGAMAPDSAHRAPSASTAWSPNAAAVHNRREPGRWGSPVQGPDTLPSTVRTVGTAPASGSSSSALAPQAQLVELIELGGAHNFQPDCLTPIGLLNVDGWCFLYDQDDVESASHLVGWHQRLCRALKAASQIVQEDVLLQHSNRAMTTAPPPILLIGTKLIASSHGTGSAVSEAAGEASPSALPDEAYLDTNWIAASGGDAKRKRPRPQGSTQSGHALRDVVSLWRKLPEGAMVLCATAAEVVNQLRPSYILSESRQSETRRRHWYTPVLETFARLFLMVERFVLLLMATFLFGPYQEVIPLRHYTAPQAIRLLRDLPQCRGHVRLALHSRPNLEASLEDLLHFLDTLQQTKVERTAAAA